MHNGVVGHECLKGTKISSPSTDGLNLRIISHPLRYLPTLGRSNVHLLSTHPTNLSFPGYLSPFQGRQIASFPRFTTPFAHRLDFGKPEV